MPYRHAQRIPDRVQVEAPDESLARFDVSGDDGRGGDHGAPGANGGHGGSDGQRGGDASPAEPGQPAGSVRVTLATADVDGICRLSGTRVTADGTEATIDEIVTFGQRGTIDLLARGGDGGRGGNGGAGGHGGRGRDGSDATRYSSGSNGGAGGDGGDGGFASSGAPGGRGGRVQLVVAEQDTQLLMLTRHRVDGGRGGAPGSNGPGGSGGRGGDGGSSYSWTESESYTDAEGNRQTRTTYHSNSGGSDGAHGSSGRPGMAQVTAGDHGGVGTFEIEVVGDDGAVTAYPSRYDLRLTAFEHASANEDNVYEPRETVRVFGLVVENCGGMPTPKHRELHLTLVDAGWVQPVAEHLVMPRSLVAGETLRLAGGELRFVVGDYQPPGPVDPLEREDTILHRARLPSVHRDFEAYQRADAVELGHFVVRFPSRASPLESLYGLAPGQSSALRFTVTNQSTGDLGSASSCRRVVRVRVFGVDSELGSEHVALFDPSGTQLRLEDGYSHEIDRLEAGGAHSFELTLGVRADAPHYRSAALWLSLELGYLDEPAKARTVQFRAFRTRVSRPYRHVDGADLLLVVNHCTTREELAGWEALAARLGFALSVWDLSLHGHLDLHRQVGGGASLLDAFRGKTMVVTDNAIETAAGQTRPSSYLAKAQLFDAAAAGINVALIGAGRPLEPLLVPTDCEVPVQDPAQDPAQATPLPSEYPSVAAFMGALTVAPVHALGKAAESVGVQTTTWRWSRPRPEQVAAAAMRVQARLRDRFPDRRYIVVYDFAPALQSKFLLRGRWRVGSLSLLRTLDAAAGTVAHTVASDVQIHDPAYVLSAANLRTLLLARGFDEKLARLRQLLYPPLALPAPAQDAGNEREELGGAIDVPDDDRAALIHHVVEALLVDLVHELQAVLTSGWRRGLSRRNMRERMAHLQQLAAFRPEAALLHPPGSVQGNAIIWLCAWLRFAGESQVRWWEWLPPLMFMRRAVAARRLVRDAVEQVLTAAFDEDNADVAREHVARRVKQLDKEYKDQVSSVDKATGRRGQWAVARLLEPIAGDGVTTDAEVARDVNGRVYSRESYAQVVAQDAADAHWRAQLLAANEQANAALLRAESTAELSRRSDTRSS